MTPADSMGVDGIGPNNPNRWVALGDIDQLRNTFRVEPVVACQQFAILSVSRHRSECYIVVFYRPNKLLVDMNLDLWVFLGILLCDFKRLVRTAIVYDRIVPISICLR